MRSICSDICAMTNPIKLLLIQCSDWTNQLRWICTKQYRAYLYEILLKLISQFLLKMIPLGLVVAMSGIAIHVKTVIYLCILFFRCAKIMFMTKFLESLLSLIISTNEGILSIKFFFNRKRSSPLPFISIFFLTCFIFIKESVECTRFYCINRSINN